ncbi:YbaB/EbfC family nucleoid-associated protein [Actinomadura barringtoniae]|uniref:YbaB/EbfC family nucleoid-associated protein n=1 Tax=Actinomadura barringtoniae TaxID=1427535 RepID=A0A939P6V8_9ACTN|nr:YbaB/EbfC family nucleoid-associated protein [Actinomadura barringtoniae]MBO2446087.1 YbaB/EbfC family nucleoid-associated protein [Actinomadura barringtoniae]
MSYELAADDLDKLLGDTLRAATAAHPGAEARADVRAEGYDEERLVKAVVSAGGRIENVEISQRALRLGSHEIADRAVTAINDALDRLAKAAVENPSPSAEALAELSQRLQQTQDMSVQQLRAYTRSLQDLMNSF